MLTLRPDQLERMAELCTERQAGALRDALAAAWPAVAEQLGDRWPAFVNAALAHGRTLGWHDADDLAAYAGLCCLWGAGFIAKPGFEAAAALVADARRTPALRLHQLRQLSRGVLLARPGPVTAEALDAALVAVSATLARARAATDIFTDQPPPAAPRPCDLDELAFELRDGAPPMEYRHGAEGWQRVAQGDAAPAREIWREAPESPGVHALTSHAPGAGPAAELRLKLSAPQHCDEHPVLTHQAAAGRGRWQGEAAVRRVLPLHAIADEPGAGIAAPGTVDVHTVAVQTCGLRDAGAPFGAPALALHVHPATQWLLQLQQGERPTLALEADGAPRDASAWQAAWRELPLRCQAGLEKLLNAWAREATPGTERLSGRCDALTGSAGLTWGWRCSGPGAVAMRVDGQVDFTALDLDLTLEGEIAFAGASAQLRLQLQGREDWREAVGGERPLADVKRSWRYPVRLALEPKVADGPLIAMLPAPPEMAGALVGRCGLRPRPDGRGWQWHFLLELEPVSVLLAAADPLLGEQRTRRELLPALTLVDWSAG